MARHAHAASARRAKTMAIAWFTGEEDGAGSGGSDWTARTSPWYGGRSEAMAALLCSEEEEEEAAANFELGNCPALWIVEW
jgi:hypothetical protein